jgi:hypothetical protein
MGCVVQSKRMCSDLGRPVGLLTGGRWTDGHHLGSGIFFFFLESWGTSSEESSEDKEGLATSPTFSFFAFN